MTASWVSGSLPHASLPALSVIHVARFAVTLRVDFAECSLASPSCCRSPSPRPFGAPDSDDRTESTGREPWQIIPQPQSSLVYARDGSLIGEIGRESRTQRLDPHAAQYVGQAFVAVEDQRFYQHDGVDLIGVAGAIKDKILGHRRPAAARAPSRSSSSGTCIPT